MICIKIPRDYGTFHTPQTRMRLRPRTGKERNKDSASPTRKKRFPIPIPGRLKSKMNADEEMLWELFNQTDLIKEIERDCPALQFSKYAQKLIQIRLWLKHGDPEATQEYYLRVTKYDALTTHGSLGPFVTFFE